MAPTHTPPEIDYLAKDYAGFHRLLRDHMSLWAPGWTEWHAADMANALIEVLAYAADYLSYHQDAVATEAYLGTARLRRSIRRHARLLDCDLHEGCNARVWVQVQVGNAWGEGVLPKGTQLITRLIGREAEMPIQRDTSAYLDALARAPIVFETMYAVKLCEAHNTISFYTGDTNHRLEESGRLEQIAHSPAQRGVWLKEGATRGVLHDPEETLRLKVGDVLIFEETRNPETGREEDVDPTHRHPVRLTRVTRTTHDSEGTLDIEWDVDDALPFDLCLSVFREGSKPAAVGVARGNIVLADHGRTIANEELPPVPQRGRYYPHLSRKGLTFSEPFHRGRSSTLPAKEMLNQDPYRALPSLELRELGLAPLPLKDGKAPLLPLERRRKAIYSAKKWVVRRELLSSGTFERDCAVEMEDDGRAYLRFGFLRSGWKPETVGAPFIATYRIGNGSIGNVSRDTIAHVVTGDGRITGVRNPLPAQGGVDPADTAEARLHATEAFRRRERCVTTEDYREIAERHPEVAHAVVRCRWTGSWRIVSIYVDRHKDRPVDENFRGELLDFMEPCRLAGCELEIRAAQFVPLEIELKVSLQPKHQAGRVRAAALEAFSDKTLPDGKLGFFHPDNWTFGDAVYQSRVIARAMAVPGIARVEVKRFRRRDTDRDDDPIPAGPLEIIQVHNDPDDPSKGTITFNFQGAL